ncbi:hypothetical protein [Escherichia coli]|uniref:hypothetical protein n=1 Tax=Escherichia coli TaxID=562 RepID=UPI000F53FA36|nr:hypothetical protein [Escherichia coli]
MISIAFASYILLALVVHLTLKQASYNGVKPSSKSRLPANQFPAAGLAVDFASNITRSMPARREIASKKIAAIKVWFILSVSYDTDNGAIDD